MKDSAEKEIIDQVSSILDALPYDCSEVLSLENSMHSSFGTRQSSYNAIDEYYFDHPEIRHLVGKANYLIEGTLTLLSFTSSVDRLLEGKTKFPKFEKMFDQLHNLVVRATEENIDISKIFERSNIAYLAIVEYAKNRTAEPKTFKAESEIMSGCIETSLSVYNEQKILDDSKKPSFISRLVTTTSPQSFQALG